ncbi:MAG TPA: DUF4214 domain-containing protein [Pirellulales bacterium]|nr:DUF4214 domain-containing protein [Pirellulales bacterium]
MFEPMHLSLSRRGLGRQRSRRGLPERNLTACVEPLEPRRMLTIPPVVPVTQFTSSFALNAGSIPDLAVSSTIGFAPTGDLFVQTSNGVATIHYTGMTSGSFTGCSVVGDTYDVGAGDTSGTLNPTYHAVFQATHDTFEFTISNQTNLPSNGNSFYYSMFWSSVGGSNHNFYTLLQDSPGHFKFVNFADYSAGQDVPGHGTNSALPDFQVSNSGATTIEVPYMPINSARIYLFLGPSGTTSPLSTQNDSPSVWSVVQPASGSANYIYDYFEANFDANGTNATSGANPYLSMMTIDTTQVDQFGIPMTLIGNSNDGQTITPYASGVTDSSDVARDQIISEFGSLHPSGDLYHQLIVGPSSSSNGLDLRILNPADADITTSSALGYVFDSAIKQLFETGSNTLDLVSNADGTTYTGTRTQVTADDSSNTPHTYNAIKYTNGTNTFYIYEPFFSTNAPTPTSLSPVDYTSAPPPPKWITVNSGTSETAGQMVFANDGVFADYKVQLPALDATQQGILGDLENQVVAALNRGVSSLNSSEWQDSSKFYQTDPVFNEYAQFLHEEQINGTPIMINGDAYGFPYDDNGNNSTKLSLQNQVGATVALGPWTAFGPSGNSISFLTAVYSDVLHRALDPAGQTYWFDELAAGLSRVLVSSAIVTSLESETDIIDGFYTSLLHRSADAQGVSTMLNLFAAGYSQAQIKAMFYGSEEYFQTRGGGTNTGFLTALYHDELNRAPDSQGEAYYSGLLTDGQSRGDVASLMIASQEAIQDVVQSYYQAYLSRPADAAGLTYWTSVLVQNDRNSLVQSGLLGSDEYYQLR